MAYLKSLPQVKKIYRKVDVKEKFHHRKNKRMKETIYAENKKHFVELKLRNRKKNIKLKYHNYSISKLRIEVKSKIKVK